MREIPWNIVEIGWFLAFEILLAFALRIALIGMTFLPIALLFVYLFGTTVKKFSSSWIVWSVPYAFSSIFFLSFFTKGNDFTFLFKTFWLSLSQWFSAPISHFALASIFFLVTYVVAYFIAHLLERTLNTSMALAVIAVISGVSTQYCCPVISMGFGLLFVISFLLSLSERKLLSRTTIVVFSFLLLLGLLFFSIGTLHTPFTPLKDVFSFSTSSTPRSAQSTPVTSPSTLERNGLLLRRNVLVRRRESTYVPAGTFENVLFEVIIYVVGGFILAFGALYIWSYFRYRRKSKEKGEAKGFLFAMWILGSATFILMILIYIFNIFSGHLEKSKAVHFFRRLIPSSGMTVQNHISFPASNLNTAPAAGDFMGVFLWTVLAVFGTATALYMFVKFFKNTVSLEEKPRNGETAEVEIIRENFEEPPSSATPSQKILHCYHLLRRRVGDPSDTPYEFERYVREKLKIEDIERVTKLFVALRYAHAEVSEKDADYVCQWVKKVLQR